MSEKDFLFLHLRDLPYFRALVRAVEATYYQDLDLPTPVYDVGCGDGHFASLTFDRKIDVGLDPWHGPADGRRGHASGVRIPETRYSPEGRADPGNQTRPEHYDAAVQRAGVGNHFHLPDGRPGQDHHDQPGNRGRGVGDTGTGGEA